jgi:2OG-Fe dioxygenase
MHTSTVTRHSSELALQGYTVVPADAVVPVEERLVLERQLFIADRLEADREAVHPSRSRVDDIVAYAWHDGRLLLNELPGNHPDPSLIDIRLTRNFSEPRYYRRFAALQEKGIERLLRGALEMVPEPLRRANGHCGVHVIRTTGVVVPVWHRDGNRSSPVDWVVAYVVSKRGAGGITKLARDRRGHDVLFEHELSPGELAMHQDQRYYHYVTPVCQDARGDGPDRCAVIVMVRPPLE